jgi:hypothetical protein
MHSSCVPIPYTADTIVLKSNFFTVCYVTKKVNVAYYTSVCRDFLPRLQNVSYPLPCTWRPTGPREFSPYPHPRFVRCSLNFFSHRLHLSHLPFKMPSLCCFLSHTCLLFHASNRIGLIIVLVWCMRGNYSAFPYVVFFILLISLTGPRVLPHTSFVYLCVCVCVCVIDIELFWLKALPESVHDWCSFSDRRKTEVCVISDLHRRTNVRPSRFCDVTKRTLRVVHVSGHLIAPFFKGQAVREGWIDTLSGNVHNWLPNYAR